ncbi:MAG: hypothetical protein P8Y54_14785 [Xanthomonadales bacterium]
MPSSAGNDASAVLPQAKKRSLNTVARAAGFRRRRKKASETHHVCGWRKPQANSCNTVERSRFSPQAKEGKRNTLFDADFLT